MSEHYKYFENKQCEYYPCHKGVSHINCLFCYCPMYAREKCLGNPKYIEYEGKVVKDCSDCTFPHNKENYEDIMKYLNLEK